MTGPHSPIGIQPPGYRLPEATRLGRVRLQVSGLARSLSFYENVLGFQVLDRDDGRAVLGAEQGDEVLVELIQHPGAKPVPPRGRLGLFHVAFLLPERSALGSFLRHLTERDIRPGMSDHLVSEALYLSDPDGLGIEVYADRPRSSWRRDGRQLAMATDPLDVQDLLAAAGRARWAGAPGDTSIGHVHLHVGDLDEASTFYHDALGFDKVVWNYPGALFLSAGGYHHHLGTNTWAGNAPPAGEDEARLLEWTILLPTADEAEAAAESLGAGGYRVSPDERGWHASDPWGTAIRLATQD